MQNTHWSKVISDSASNSDEISAEERRRRDAVWELFTSECVFLLDHLMALKHVSHISSLDVNFFLTLFRNPSPDIGPV